MKLPGYYSSGEFARMAKVSVRTIRFYDQQNILKPSYVTDKGARFYTDADFVKLQQILLLKYLGFSLDDIRELIVGELDYRYLMSSLRMQKKLIQDRIEQMQSVETMIDDTIASIDQNQEIGWSRMLDLIHMTGMEKSLKNQYIDANNISARISLHEKYSTNPQGWFPWLFEQCDIADGMRVLELGCGNGTLWSENISLVPQQAKIVVSDISEGMLRDARRNIGVENDRFAYEMIDCRDIPYEDKSFDLVIANHLLFYCEDIGAVCREVCRVLKPGGRFVCSTYGSGHMKEITTLVQAFDKEIVLAAEQLYERFGLDNGADILEPHFASVQKVSYEDGIEIGDSQPLIEYILSCHGNQNPIIAKRFKEFREYVEHMVSGGMHISKEAGAFICKK